MNCKSWMNLSIADQRIFIGEITHCIQNDDVAFGEVAEIINRGLRKGTLKNVEFIPDHIPGQTPMEHINNDEILKTLT